MTYRDAAERVVLTFSDAALAVVVTAGTGLLDFAVWKGAAVVGAAAGISTLRNFIRVKLSQRV